MAYAVVALLADDFWIPGRRGPGIHLSGVALWFACAGFGCLCVALVSVLVDHFDQRNNEKSYAKVLRLFALGGAGLFVIALVLHWLKIGGWM